MSTTVTVVLYRPRLDWLDRALEALALQTAGPIELMVHINDDDGSLAETVRSSIASSTFAGQVSVSSSPANLGFSGGHNRLLESAFAAGATLAVVHNPDLVLAPDAIERLVAVVDDGLRLLGPVLEQADPVSGLGGGFADTLGIRWTVDGRHLDIGHGEPLPVTIGESPIRVEGISGACLAVPRAAYKRIVEASGEFFDADFIAYREDAELALRAGLLGIESWLVPSARGLHVRSQRGTERGQDAHIDLLGVRNRFLIAAKWGRRRPGIVPLAVLRDALVIVAVFVQERRSIPALMQAWRLRQAMRAKRRRVLAWMRDHPVGEP